MACGFCSLRMRTLLQQAALRATRWVVLSTKQQQKSCTVCSQAISACAQLVQHNSTLGGMREKGGW